MNNELQSQLEALKKNWDSLSPTLDLETKKQQTKDFQKEMAAPDFWSDQSKAQTVSQKAAHLEKFIETAQNLETGIQNLEELLEMASEGDLEDLEIELNNLESRIKNLEVQVLLNGEYDEHDAIVSIHVGTGGQDAEEFTLWLQRMYLRYAEQQEAFKVSILEESMSDVGLKSCTLEIKGPFAYGYLKAEHGVQRLIRLSPFNAKNLRQTSFAKVEVIPLLENDNALEIDPSELRIDVFRSSGAGGQSVNTTDSAVRITYLPLNIVVTCQNERSQAQNKDTAMKVLRSKIIQLKEQEQVDKVSEIRGASLKADFSNQIRTFTLQPYQLVKDHRTNYEEGNPEKVLDGHIEGFIEAWLKQA